MKDAAYVERLGLGAAEGVAEWEPNPATLLSPEGADVAAVRDCGC